MRRTAVLVAALVLLAGCGGQGGVTPPENPQTTAATTGDPTTGGTTTQPPGTPATTDPVQRVNVTEQGASLGDVNATKVWQRVGELVSMEAPEPPHVVVYGAPASGRVEPTHFQRSLGAENATVSTTFPGGRYEASAYEVRLYRPPGASDAQLESVLAHEFAHAYQFSAGRTLPSDVGWMAKAAVDEGAVNYVQWLYADRYIEGYDEERAYSAYFERAPPVNRLVIAEYRYGAQYTRKFGDPGAPLTSMYEDPPTTAEQVLHLLPPGSEPPRNLTVHGQSGEAGVFLAANVKRRGEASLRYILEVGLPKERAARAAAGWGNDRRMRFDDVEGDSYAWVVRWDSPAEAREFERAFGEFRANVSEPLALATVGDETTVILSGREAFVANATVSGTAGNVTVAA